MKWIRMFLLTLIISALVGVAIGMLIRRELERPERYIGRISPTAAPLSAVPAGPLHVADTRAVVLEPRKNEEQIGEPVQIADARVG